MCKAQDAAQQCQREGGAGQLLHGVVRVAHGAWEAGIEVGSSPVWFFGRLLSSNTFGPLPAGHGAVPGPAALFFPDLSSHSAR